MASLILLSVSTLSASVLVALTGLSRGVVDSPTTSLPEVLLARDEVQVRVAPVKEEIEAEAAPSLAPSPESTLRRTTPKSSPSANPAAPAVATVGALSLSLTGQLTDRGPRDVVTYTATIRSTGTAAVSGIRFSSHIPLETTWETSECNGSGLPVSISYSGEPSSLVCVAGPNEVQGAGDATHQVELTLGRSLAPGATATITFRVHAEKKLKQVSNHAHADSGSIRADSDTITTKI